MSLIDQLNALQGHTPDEIVTLITDPFPRWAQGGIVTPELYAKYAEYEIVVCHRSYRERTRQQTERGHRLGSHRANAYWSLEEWNTGMFREGGSFWFRSRKSYEANRDEPF